MPYKDPEKRRQNRREYCAANPDKVREWEELRREKKREYMRRYNAENREKTAAYRAANKAKRAARNHLWRTANPDKIKEYRKRYAALHPDRLRDAAKRRRSENTQKFRERDRAYRARNRDHINGYRYGYQLHWNVENSEKIKGYQAAYRERNRDILRVQASRYYSEHTVAIAKKRRSQRVTNPDYFRQQAKARRDRNIEQYHKTQCAWRNGRDPRIRMWVDMRKRLAKDMRVTTKQVPESLVDARVSVFLVKRAIRTRKKQPPCARR